MADAIMGSGPRDSGFGLRRLRALGGGLSGKLDYERLRYRWPIYDLRRYFLNRAPRRLYELNKPRMVPNSVEHPREGIRLLLNAVYTSNGQPLIARAKHYSLRPSSSASLDPAGEYATGHLLAVQERH
jgi:hypothetical protein